MNLIAQLEAEQIAALGNDIPDFKAGDTIRVGYKVTEGTRTRVQNYEGVCISRKNGHGIAGSFTVRKISFGEGVSVCSRCIRPMSTVSQLFAGAVCAAPSCIICGRVVVNLRGLPKSLITNPKRAHRRKERTDEKRHPSRLSLYRC